MTSQPDTATDAAKTDERPVRVIIADDHPLVRSGISTMFEDRPGYTLLAEASTADQAVELVQTHKPDILLLDIGLPQKSGIEVLCTLKQLDLPTRVIVITMQESELMAKQAILAGARAYVLKDLTPEHLMLTIDRVLAGGVILSEQFKHLITDIEKALKNPGSDASLEATEDPLHKLSKREREIFFLLTNGVPNRDIAKQLFISPRTVETHRARILKKLDVGSTTDLIKFGIKNGLIVA